MTCAVGRRNELRFLARRLVAFLFLALSPVEGQPSERESALVDSGAGPLLSAQVPIHARFKDD